MRTQNTITKLYNKIYQLEKWETETAAAKIEAKLKDAKEKAQPILDQLAEVEKAKKERDAKYQAAIGDYKKLEQEIEDLQKKFEAFEKKDIEKREEYKRVKSHGKKQAQQLETEEANRKQLETMPETRCVVCPLGLVRIPKRIAISQAKGIVLPIFDNSAFNTVFRFKIRPSGQLQ